MKTKTLNLLFLAIAALVLQGCISIPPLIQVEHKENNDKVTNQEVLRRLDAIDRRLDQMEKK